MEGVSSNWLIPAGAILAALIAGLFSFFNLVLSKEQKLSELRQSWIDGLRDDIAAYFAAIQAIEYIVSVYQYQHKEHKDLLNHIDLCEATHESHMQSNIAYSRILLRLNPNDENLKVKALLSELKKMAELFNDGKYKEVSNCVPETRKEAQQVLKDEWERVKKGEPTFRWSKRIALLILSAAIVLGAYLAIHGRVQPHSGVVKSDVTSEAHSQAGAANKSMEPTR